MNGMLGRSACVWAWRVWGVIWGGGLLGGVTVCASEGWRWVNLSDWHQAEGYARLWEGDISGKGGGAGWGARGHESLAAYEAWQVAQDVAVLGRLKADYGGEVLLIPGDTNGGHWHSPAYRSGMRSVYPGLDDAEVVRRAAYMCYGGFRYAVERAGYDRILVAVGDHEIGDNPWPAGSAVARLVGTYKAGFADVFNRVGLGDRWAPGGERVWGPAEGCEEGPFRYDEPIGAAPARPVGTPYAGTSYAWRYRDTLFVTVDIFLQESAEEGHGEQGTVVGEMTGEHLEWFREVLSEASRIPDIRHVVVQSHLPVLYPVRKYASSGMLVEGNAGSRFMEAMREGGVDLYLSGEVHANTVTVDAASGLVQWVSRGNGASNFSTVDTGEDWMTIETWKNGGERGADRLLGRLEIRREADGKRTVQGSGQLRPIDPDAAILRYAFDLCLSADQILTAVAEGVVSGHACGEAFENSGEFGDEYTAWADGVTVEPGIIGSAVRLEAGKSVLGLSAMGPMEGGRPRSVGMWIRTTASGRRILFNTASYWGKAAQFFNLSLNDGRFEVAIAPDVVKRVLGEGINDGAWHHVAAVVPHDGATLSEVSLYVDGVLQEAVQETGGSTRIDTSQANWIGLGVLLSRSSLNLSVQMGMEPFEGWLDDFGLWTRAMTAREVAELYATGLTGHGLTAALTPAPRGQLR